MSSSLRYTLTNRWSWPVSSIRLSASPGCSAVSVRKTSPTVAPSAETVAAPPACDRSSVGSRTSTGMRSSLGVHEDDLALPNCAVPDPVRAQHRVRVLEAHEDVDPERLERLTDIGIGRVGVTVRVGMPDPDEVLVSRLGVTHGAEELTRVDGVGASRRIRVRARID